MSKEGKQPQINITGIPKQINVAGFVTPSGTIRITSVDAAPHKSSYKKIIPKCVMFDEISDFPAEMVKHAAAHLPGIRQTELALMQTYAPDTPHEGTVIYTWIPKESEKHEKDDDLADAYKVFSDPRAASGIIVYALFGERWVVNPWNIRPLIRNLIERLNSK